MSNIIPPDVQCFDVERALAKALAVKCETFVCSPASDEFRIRIGLRWNLVLNSEQLGALWQDCDQPSTTRAAFDDLKADCLAFQSLQR